MISTRLLARRIRSKSFVTLTSAVGINDSLLILANGVGFRARIRLTPYLYQASFIQLAPATLNFAMLAVGATSLAQSVTVTNTGTTAIPFGTAYVNGDFSLRADNCGASSHRATSAGSASYSCQK